MASSLPTEEPTTVTFLKYDRSGYSQETTGQFCDVMCIETHNDSLDPLHILSLGADAYVTGPKPDHYARVFSQS